MSDQWDAQRASKRPARRRDNESDTQEEEGKEMPQVHDLYQQQRAQQPHQLPPGMYPHGAAATPGATPFYPPAEGIAWAQPPPPAYYLPPYPLPAQQYIQPHPHLPPQFMDQPIPPPYFLAHPQHQQAGFPPPQGVYYPPQNPPHMVSQTDINRMRADAAQDPNAARISANPIEQNIPPLESYNRNDPGASHQDTLSTSSSIRSDNCKDPDWTKLNPEERKIMKRKAKKNAQSRARAARLREKIEEVKKKGDNEKSEAEIALLDTFEERRRRKNERSRQRAIEKKREIERILAIPEAQRSMEDRETLDRAMKAKFRKNEGDRIRRERLKLGTFTNSKKKTTSGKTTPSSSSSTSRTKKRKASPDGTGGEYSLPDESASPPGNAPAEQMVPNMLLSDPFAVPSPVRRRLPIDPSMAPALNLGQDVLPNVDPSQQLAFQSHGGIPREDLAHPPGLNMSFLQNAGDSRIPPLPMTTPGLTGETAFSLYDTAASMGNERALDVEDQSHASKKEYEV
eukprot:CAMPEP_0178946042 /NCGR_PEP_ID=MMETSP0789-20121207/4061_1 /TAXON_ID=3005 /ORGANISM="Rhizosolenia setigera, Strain CCMP 1694" /LENGTH=511 /DNA_ID=CAMNT_0020625981 /DNA_START=102 /DNA_END=1637 /DNA_ORIENTATION=+